MIKKFKIIKTFDTVTQFRSINGFVVMLGLYLLIPILVDIRGELLSTAFISSILILSTLAVKYNKYFVNNYTIASLYKMGVFVHLSLLINSIIYFHNPLYFVIIESFISILEVAILSSYSIKLDVYQSKNYPDDVESFKIFRNSSIADATLIGLSIVAITSYFFSRDINLYIFIFYNTFLSIYLFTKWSFYDKFFGKSLI